MSGQNRKPDGFSDFLFNLAKDLNRVYVTGMNQGDSVARRESASPSPAVPEAAKEKTENENN